jgi:hypothetical protein
MKEAVNAWFVEGEFCINEHTAQFLGGVYGVNEVVWAKRYQKAGTTKKYLFSRLFPPFELMKQNWPVLQKFPVVLPFCYLARFVRGFLFHSKKSTAEYRYIQKRKKEEKREKSKK